MKEALPVRDRDLEVSLIQRRWNGEDFRVDFADKDPGTPYSARHGFESTDFRRYRCCEQERLPLVRWREGGEALFDIREHAAFATVK